jgi:hypothetical protein
MFRQALSDEVEVAKRYSRIKPEQRALDIVKQLS